MLCVANIYVILAEIFFLLFVHVGSHLMNNIFVVNQNN